MSQDNIQNLENRIKETNTKIEKAEEDHKNIKKYIKTQEQLHRRILEFELKNRRKQSDKLKQTVQDHQKRLRQVEIRPQDNNTVNTSPNNELQNFYKNQFYKNVQKDLKNCLN
jgi:chromosome segregation ATPase